MSEGLPATLELLSDRAVPGAQRHGIGSWRLRAGLGATGRANSTWAPGPPNGSVSDAIDEVEAWYRSRGLNPRFQVYDDPVPELTAELDRREWPTTVDSLVMIAPIPTVVGRAPLSAASTRAVAVAAHPTPAFAGLFEDRRRLTEVTETELPQRIVTISDGDVTLGGGMGTIDGTWAAVGAMNTRLEVRRRGVASTVLAALATVAADLGADTVWLQVQSDNHGAVALYEGMGFETVHRYRYRYASGR